MSRFVYIVALGILVGCIEQVAQPDVTAGEFAAGDTTYLRLNPIWGSSFGLSAPVEVSISHARQIFVADTGLKDVAVFNFSGVRLDQRDSLYQTLEFGHLGTEFRPLDIDIDGKLNLLVIDGGNKVYRWNQFWNIEGIDSVATRIVVQNVGTGEMKAFDSGDELLITYLNSADWTTVWDSTRFARDAAVIDSLLRPHIFLDMDLPVNDIADLFYRSNVTRFSAISSARLGDDIFYVTDSVQNRMVVAALKRNGLVKLADDDGTLLYTHTARFAANSVEKGTGNGTLNLPTGLDVDDNGNILYTQHGEFVYFHSIAPIAAQSYPANFELQVHEIMDSTWFDQPTDVAVDENLFIYVANSGAQEVLVFNGSGDFFRKAGIERAIIETTLQVISGGDTMAVDTFYVAEIKGELQNPVSLDVDENGVIYVCDPERSQIVRYVLSTNLDDDLVGIDQ